MDWTLIKTKEGNTFAKNASDWLFWHERVPTKLRRLVADGYRIVVFTNQGGVHSGKTNIAELKVKFKAIQEKLGKPMTFMAATGSW